MNVQAIEFINSKGPVPMLGQFNVIDFKDGEQDAADCARFPYDDAAAAASAWNRAARLGPADTQ